MSLYNWSTKAHLNGSVDPSLPALDGAAARTFMPALRSLMAAAARYAQDNGGALVTTGVGNAFVVNTASGVNALVAGLSLTILPDRDNTAEATINVDGTGPKAWLDADGSPLSAGRVKRRRPTRITYDAVLDGWRCDVLSNIGNDNLNSAPPLTVKGNPTAGSTQPQDVSLAVLAAFTTVKDSPDAFDTSLEEATLERVSVMRFIPYALRAGIRAGSNTTPLTAYIQKAVDYVQNRGGGELWFRRGAYLVDGPVVIANGRVHCVGEGAFTTHVQSSNNTQPLFIFKQFRCAVRRMALGFTSAQSGATAISLDGASDFCFDNIYILGCDIGILTQNLSIVRGHTFIVGNYLTAGIACWNNSLEVHIRSFILDAGNGTNGGRGGIWLKDFVDAFNATTGDVLLGKHGITTEAAVFAPVQRPGNSKFSGVYFDSSTEHAAVLNQLTNTDFTSCWFSGGRSGTGFNGVRLGQSDSVTFTTTEFFACGSDGFYAGPDATRFILTACKADSNGQRNLTSAGFNIVGSREFQIIGGITRSGLYPGGQQSIGLSINSSATGVVAFFDMTGSANAPIYLDPAAIVTFRDCPGYATEAEKTTSVVFDTDGIGLIPHGLAGTPKAWLAAVLCGVSGTTFTEARAVPLAVDATNLKVGLVTGNGTRVTGGTPTYLVMWRASL